MKTLTTGIAIVGMATLLAACGDTRGERALSGGALGAGAGAVGGALLGDPVTGAVIGGAAGAATGALTDKEDISLD